MTAEQAPTPTDAPATPAARGSGGPFILPRIRKSPEAEARDADRAEQQRARREACAKVRKSADTFYAAQQHYRIAALDRSQAVRDALAAGVSVSETTKHAGPKVRGKRQVLARRQINRIAALMERPPWQEDQPDQGADQ